MRPNFSIPTAWRSASFAWIEDPRLARIGLLVFVICFAVIDIALLVLVTRTQPLAVDFAPLWTGARVDPGRLYDFAFVTKQQTWIHTRALRPFVYPPTALLLFKPLAALPFWPAYVTLVTASAAAFAWAARRLGADWKLALLPFPVLLVALAGQVTFLIGALVMTAVTLRNRPLIAGLLYGFAGVVKPQMLMLLPLALAFEGAWRTFVATGVSSAAFALASLAFGASWINWWAALHQFSDLLVDHFRDSTLSPTIWLGPASLVFTIPAAIVALWLAFRSGGAPQRVIALLGGALLLSPYALSYELALLIPAMLALRKSLVWSAPFWIALACFPSGTIALIAAMALLFASLASEQAWSESLRGWPRLQRGHPEPGGGHEGG